MARRAILTVVTWICLACTAGAPTLTFPALTGRVVDEAGLLDVADRASLTEALAGLEAKTTDQLVIVTLKSLRGTTIEDYGYQLGRRWQIGQKDKDNGVLLIVAPNERKVRIEVGYGLEGTLTDALTKVIIENAILPRFKTGDFAGGIRNGTAEIIQVLTGDAGGLAGGTGQNLSPDANGANPDASDWPLIILAVAGVGLLIFCSVTRGGGVCRVILLMLFSGGGGSSGGTSGGSSFSGGGGSFGGGGSSGSW